MSDNDNGDGENGNGDNGNGKVQFRRKDGIEKDGYICFPVELPPEEVEETEVEQEERGEDGEEEVKDTGRPVKYDMSVCPEDPRFQQMNTTKWCYRMYVDFHRCRLLLGESANQCNYFYRCYNELCPNHWIEKWDDQVKEGSFPRSFAQDYPQPTDEPCP